MFWVGVAVGAVAAHVGRRLLGHAPGTVSAYPKFPKPVRRVGRRGKSWR